MEKNEIVEILKKIGAVITDSHFVYTSGKHGSVYINKDALYPHTEETSRVGELFAQKYKDLDIEVVVAPAVGGTILSQWTAYHLSILRQKEVLSAYTEKDKGTTASASGSEQIFRRGYDKIVKGKRALVVEDLTTTGMSVKKVVEAVKKAEGIVVAVGVMINRDPEHVNARSLGFTFDALGVILAQAYNESECPLCKKNIPINTEFAHGKEYLVKKKRTA